MDTFRTLLAVITTMFGMLLAVPVLVLAVPLFVVSFLTRRIAYRLEPQVMVWGQLIEFCPTIGWKPKPHLDGYALADDVFYLTTDADGWRGKTSIDESEVVIFGDSHAFGHSADDQYYFGNLSGAARIKAIGANGYNLVQELLWMRELSPKLRNKLVVWFIFSGNDLLDNIEPSMHHYRAPFVREVKGACQWEIVTEHVNATPWPLVSLRYRQTNYDRLIQTCSPTSVARRAFSACRFLLAQGAEVCKRAGARLVIMTIPDPLQLSQQGLDLLCKYGGDPKLLDLDLPDKEIRAICNTLGLPMIVGKEYLAAEDYKKYDDHWNERGHRRMAALLNELYDRYAVVEVEGVNHVQAVTYTG